jgi:hypothetical protein
MRPSVAQSYRVTERVEQMLLQIYSEPTSAAEAERTVVNREFQA